MKRKISKSALLLFVLFVSCTFAITGCSKIGVVDNNAITSSDSIAYTVKNSLSNFLTDADTSGYGMIQGAETIIEFTVDNHSWTVYAVDASVFKQSDSVTWGTTQEEIKANDSKESVSSGERLLGINLANIFSESEKGSMWAYCKDGTCLYAMYSPDFTDRISSHSDVPTLDDFKSGSFAWNGNDGIGDSGYIIGTNPKLIKAS